LPPRPHALPCTLDLNCDILSAICAQAGPLASLCTQSARTSAGAQLEPFLKETTHWGPAGFDTQVQRGGNAEQEAGRLPHLRRAASSVALALCRGRARELGRLQVAHISGGGRGVGAHATCHCEHVPNKSDSINYLFVRQLKRRWLSLTVSLPCSIRRCSARCQCIASMHASRAGPCP